MSAAKKQRGQRGPYQVKGTAKQLAYLNGLFEGKSKYRAAHEAGYKGKPSLVVAELEQSEFIRVVSAALAEHGITLETCAAKLAELMTAKEKKAFMTRAGEVVYAKEAPVYDIQLKATQTAMDMLGIGSRARSAVVEEKRPESSGVNVLLLAQQFNHLSDDQLEEAMQLMRIGQFEGSALARDVARAGDVALPEIAGAFTVDGKKQDDESIG